MAKIMELCLVGFFLVGGYFVSLQAILRRMRGQSGKGAAAVILFVLFVLCGGALSLAAWAAGSFGAVLLFLFMTLSGMAFGGFLIFFIRHFRELKKGILFLLVVYILAVLYMTVFSRIGTYNDSVKLEVFGSLAKAIRSNSLESIRHLMLNCAMFVPLGLLFPMTASKHLAKVGYVLAAGLVLSTFIESAQLIWQIGQCDIDDIIGNTFGTGIGFVMYCFFIRSYYESFND